MVVTFINSSNGGTWLTTTYESFDKLDSTARSPPYSMLEANQMIAKRIESIFIQEE